MTFGEKLRSLRLKSNFTQRELAERLDVSFTYLSKLENDRMNHPPSEDFIERLAIELQANTDELLILARRVPTDVAETIINNPDSIELLRSMRSLSRTEWLEFIRQAKRKSERR